LWALCATIIGVAAKNLASLAARRWRRRTRGGKMTAQRSTLRQHATHIIVEQRGLCELLLQQVAALAGALSQARELRRDFLRTLIELRQRVRQYAEQYALDERRLLMCVMRRLNLSQFVDFITLKGLIAIARKLEEVYQKADFESIVVDSMINEFVLLRDTQDAATKLRNYMRAIVRQYVDVTDRSEAIRFLRELAAQLELS
jgi:hypothetical protein